MSATVIELLTKGYSRLTPGCRTHRQWMEPAVPVVVGRQVVAEVRLERRGQASRIEVVFRRRVYVRLPFLGEQEIGGWAHDAVALRPGAWSAPPRHELMVRPIAKKTRDGRIQSVLVEFAALSDTAARGWPA